MCCSRIRVTLNGVVKDKQGKCAGTYQKASGLINNRSYWNKIDGEYALWWDIIVNSWTIGRLSDLGSNLGYIKSVQDSACPTSDNLFKYADGFHKIHNCDLCDLHELYEYDAANNQVEKDDWTLAPINSVSIQCV